MLLTTISGGAAVHLTAAAEDPSAGRESVLDLPRQRTARPGRYAGLRASRANAYAERWVGTVRPAQRVW